MYKDYFSNMRKIKKTCQIINAENRFKERTLMNLSNSDLATLRSSVKSGYTLKINNHFFRPIESDINLIEFIMKFKTYKNLPKGA